jgi:pimeloyl-ACP methyl ester carboxylesterase
MGCLTDIQVSLRDLVLVQKCVGPLESIGYEYLGEYGVPGRAEDVARVDEIEQRRRAGEVTHEELVHLPTTVSPPAQVGVEASIGTNRSLSKHFEAQTLMRSLPDVRVPVLFVHGEQDPLPLRSTDTTAGLIPGSRVATIPDCGHFPWLEQPAAFRSAVEELLS